MIEYSAYPGLDFHMETKAASAALPGSMCPARVRTASVSAVLSTFIQLPARLACAAVLANVEANNSIEPRK